MGGDKETIAIQTKTTTRGETKECGKIRYHENSGEVHFHDDDNGLKVAIPSGVWYNMFLNLVKQVPHEISYPDTKNKTVLHIGTRFKKAKKLRNRPARIDLDMHIESLEIDDRLVALQKFTEG